jgi:hypothetical protein
MPSFFCQYNAIVSNLSLKLKQILYGLINLTAGQQLMDFIFYFQTACFHASCQITVHNNSKIQPTFLHVVMNEKVLPSSF